MIPSSLLLTRMMQNPSHPTWKHWFHSYMRSRNLHAILRKIIPPMMYFQKGIGFYPEWTLSVFALYTATVSSKKQSAPMKTMMHSFCICSVTVSTEPTALIPVTFINTRTALPMNETITLRHYPYQVYCSV